MSLGNEPDDVDVLVLGAYGQVGRALIPRLLAAGHRVRATGRRRAPLDELADACTDADQRRRLSLALLDIENPDRLRELAARSRVVVHCAGPFVIGGHHVAEAVAGVGTHYLDIASEQAHYRALGALDRLARGNGATMVPGAGLYPGLSGLLLLEMLADYPAASAASIVMVTGLPETPDSGIASLLTGALELAIGEPLREHVGGRMQATKPTATRTFTVLRFGETAAVRWPTLEIEALGDELGNVDLRTYAALGGAPAPTASEIALLRLLRPDRRGWAHRLLSRYARYLNARLYRAGLQRHWGSECIVQVNVTDPDGHHQRELVAEDMALGTCFLVTRLTDRLLAGTRPPAGLAKPADLIAPGEVLARLDAEPSWRITATADRDRPTRGGAAR